MKTRFLRVLAVGLALGAGAARADEQPEAKVLLDRAIKAMGGEAKLAKLGTVSGKGKITTTQGGQEVTVNLQGTWQGLSQYRAELEIQKGGDNFNAIMVISGDKGWFKKNDNTEDAPEGLVPFIQNFFYAGRMPQMLPALKDNAYKLTPLGEVKVGTQPAVGFSVSHPDYKDVSLFFDKESGLPLKSEIKLTEPRRDQESTIEYHYRDYKDFDGVKLCGMITIKFNNEEFTVELIELKAAEKMDDSRFDRP
jgi:hypothetical protein